MSVAELLVPQAPPIREDLGGILRIGDTRVSLDSVVWAYNEGLSAEEIACRFPTISLDQAYGAISFYLGNKKQVDEYIRMREGEGDRVQAEMQRRFPIAEVRERILARHTKRLAQQQTRQ